MRAHADQTRPAAFPGLNVLSRYGVVEFRDLDRFFMPNLHCCSTPPSRLSVRHRAPMSHTQAFINHGPERYFGSCVASIRCAARSPPPKDLGDLCEFALQMTTHASARLQTRDVTGWA